MKISTNLKIVITAVVVIAIVIAYTKYNNNQLLQQEQASQVPPQPVPAPTVVQNIPVQSYVPPATYTPPAPPSPSELRKELAEQEAAHWSSYINLTNENSSTVIIQKPDLFHHTIVANDLRDVSGGIINAATLVTFKDAVIRVDCYSQTQTMIGEEVFTVYQLFKPGTSFNFQQRVSVPVGTTTTQISLAKVTPY
jgi:hypothetical protein